MKENKKRKFLDCLAKVSECLDGPNYSPGNHMHINCINNKIWSMRKNYEEYSSLKKIFDSSTKDEHYIRNRHFWFFLLRGFLAFQVSCIRSLVDNQTSNHQNREVYSLTKTIHLLEESSVGISRKEFVTRDDISPLYPLINDQHILAESRQNKFDRIINMENSNNRRSNNKIPQKYFEELKNKLKSDSIKSIVTYSNKVLSHMASQASIGSEEAKVNLKDIEKAINTIESVYKSVIDNFMHYSSSINPLTEGILFNINKPFGYTVKTVKS